MKFQRFILVAASFLLLTAAIAQNATAQTIYGIRTDSSSAGANVLGLTSFSALAPGTQTPVVAFTGMTAGQTVRSIDFRPSNGLLYAVSTNGAAGQLYTVNLVTAVLTPVGAAFTLPFPDPNNRTEIEFNPVTDQIRLLVGVALDGNQNPVPNNFRLDPTSGVLTQDTALNYVPGDLNAGNVGMLIVASAYSNPAAGKTTLYAFDYSNDSVVRVGSVGGTPDSPNTGRLGTIKKGNQDVTTNSGIGMDVGPTGTLYITRDTTASAATMGLYKIDANNGTQTLIGNYGAGIFVQDISVARTTTAAGVTVSGRVLISAEGRGLTNATVTLTNSHGVDVSTTTMKNGQFTFDDVASGETYILNVQSRQYRFAPQTIQVFDSVTGITVIGSPVKPDPRGITADQMERN